MYLNYGNNFHYNVPSPLHHTYILCYKQLILLDLLNSFRETFYKFFQSCDLITLLKVYIFYSRIILNGKLILYAYCYFRYNHGIIIRHKHSTYCIYKKSMQKNIKVIFLIFCIYKIAILLFK